MIVDAILNVVLVLANALWGLIPSWSIAMPVEVGNLVGEVTKWDAFLPVTELMLITSAVGAFFLVQVAVKMILLVWGWILDVIP